MEVDVCYAFVALTGEGMDENESPEIQEAERNYLGVGPAGPRRWLLVVGAFVIVAAFATTFFGLYAINQGASPTLTPDPVRLTHDAAVAAAALQAAPSETPNRATSTPSPAGDVSVTATTAPLTYTVQQGDTLIGIAQRLSVNADALRTLNQISGETIFPDQVLLLPATVTPRPETGAFVHSVTQGETLISIAAIYKVDVDEVKALNGLASDTIVVGQQILIPSTGVRPPTPTPTPEPWQPAVITGSLEAAYSLAAPWGHFNIHYPPNTRVAESKEMEGLKRLLEKALTFSEGVLERSFNGRIEVYVSASLFDDPSTALRGFSVPKEYRIFLVHDGNEPSAEQLYFATYAVTQLLANRIFGAAASPLIREGLAGFAAGQAMVSEAAQGSSYLSPKRLCAALEQAGDLPDVTQPLGLEGHLGYLDQHLAAGCFVGYLIETEGFAPIAQLYASGDYQAVYGRSLAKLAEAWVASLGQEGDPPLDPVELSSLLEGLNTAYRRLWADFAGSPAQMRTYEALGQARTAWLQGRLSSARQSLENAEELLE